MHGNQLADAPGGADLLGSVAGPVDAFVSLGTAFLSEGLVVQVPREIHERAGEAELQAGGDPVPGGRGAPGRGDDGLRRIGVDRRHIAARRAGPPSRRARRSEGTESATQRPDVTA